MDVKQVGRGKFCPQRKVGQSWSLVVWGHHGASHIHGVWLRLVVHVRRTGVRRARKLTLHECWFFGGLSRVGAL